MYVYDLITNITAIDDKLSDAQIKLSKHAEHVMREFNYHSCIRFMIFDEDGVDCFFYNAMAGQNGDYFVRVNYGDIDFIVETMKKNHYSKWITIFKTHFKYVTYARGELEFNCVHQDAEWFERKNLSKKEKENTVAELKKYTKTDYYFDESSINMFLTVLSNVNPTIMIHAKMKKLVKTHSFYDACILCTKTLNVNITNIAFKDDKVVVTTDQHTSDECHNIYSAILNVCCNYI